MKHILLIAILSSPLLKAGATWALTVDDGFIARNSVSKHLAEKLDQHTDELGHLVDKIHATEFQKHGVWSFKWLPGYFVKYNVSRVIKRELLAKCIEEENLSLLHTPEKYLYHIKGRPTELNSRNYVVICKKVHDSKKEYHKRMDLEQVTQFIKAIEKTGHVSTFEPNFLRLSDRKISFIDTDGTFNTAKPNTGFVRLLDRDLAHYYTDDALEYIIDKIAEQLVRETNKDRKKKCLSDLTMFLNRQALGTKVSKQVTARVAYYQARKREGNL